MEDTIRRIEALRKRIDAAAARSGRTPSSVRLVAVTKNHPAEAIRTALSAGIRDIGENKVQEAIPKIREVPEATYHLIGHLQSNKAKLAVEHFDLIHSVDSVHLARALNEHAAKQGKRCNILLQINASREETKSGFEVPEACDACLEILADCRSLAVMGFMTMAALDCDPETTRPVFRSLRELAESIRTRAQDKGFSVGRELSMGMTNDYEVAIEEGATMVRIGSAIFGHRG